MTAMVLQQQHPDLASVPPVPVDSLPDGDFLDLLETIDNPSTWDEWSDSYSVTACLPLTSDIMAADASHFASDAISLDPLETQHTMVGEIELELQHIVDTDFNSNLSASLDSGVDGDSDSSMSDHSSDSRSTACETLSLSPEPFPAVEVKALPTITSSVTANQRSTTMKRSAPSRLRPRSGETLVASITSRERDLLLSKFKVTVPSHLPLTKAEDKMLRSTLRKIRNKASAQRSRRNKEHYIKGLETRVEDVTRINVELGTKVSVLEEENRSLLQQLNDLRRKVLQQTGPLGGSGLTLMMAVFCVGIQTGGLNTNTNVPSGITTKFQSRTLKSFEHLEDSVDDMVWATAIRCAIFALIGTALALIYIAPKHARLPPPLSWWLNPRYPQYSPGRFSD